jgi:hypothetical protein
MWEDIDLKKAFEDSRAFPELSFDEWKEKALANAVSDQDLIALGDKWRSYNNLPRFKKLDASIRKVLTTAIKAHGQEECLLAVERYSAMLEDESYYMNYIWDIRKFFQQRNAAPDFMSNGVKWLNYVKDTNNKPEEKVKVYGTLDKDGPTIAAINVDFTRRAKAYREAIKNVVSVTRPTSTQEEYDQAVSESIVAALLKVHPVILAKVAEEHKVWIKDPLLLPGGKKTMEVTFGRVIIKDLNGNTLDAFEINREYAKLKID